MSVRLDTLNSRYQQYIDAEAAILSGAQEYMINNRRLVRGDLAEIAEMIKYLEEEIAKQTRSDDGRGSRRMFGVIPRDV